MYILIFKIYFVKMVMTLPGWFYGIKLGINIAIALPLLIIALFAFYFFIELIDDFNLSKLKERQKEALA
jgi:hypothetical protein